jgi:hypothetical protein
MKEKHMKVVRVTKIEFEIDDGRIFQHVVELDTAPSIEEFQKYLDEWYNKLPQKFIEKKYACKYRKPTICTHPKVEKTVSFPFDKNEECGKCLYTKKSKE